MKVGVALTGASGLPYGFRLVEVLLAAGHHVDLFATEAAGLVAQKEMSVSLSSNSPEKSFEGTVGFENLNGIAIKDIGGCHASGSSAPDCLVVVPCSMNTLARLAHGLGERAHERCAEVMMKESRPLVVVPREMPLGLIELKNMVALKESGAFIVPACPGFWHRPEKISDLVDFVVQRICQLLKIDVQLVDDWEG